MTRPHEHYVGPGILAKMSELDDFPASCELYCFATDENGKLRPEIVRGEASLAIGHSGRLYIYVKDLNSVQAYETTDTLMAGGNP